MSSKFEFQLLNKVADRAVALAREHGVEYPKLTALMDIEHAHRAVQLDLNAMLAADDGNFGHDVFGIRRHLNRRTFKLEDGFLPRFTVQS